MYMYVACTIVLCGAVYNDYTIMYKQVIFSLLIQQKVLDDMKQDLCVYTSTLYYLIHMYMQKNLNNLG